MSGVALPLDDVLTALAGAAGVGLAVSVPTTSSTNDEARALAVLGAPAGTVVVAGEQRAGRGRHGRTWHSAPDLGLYVSILLRPGGAPADAPAQRFTIAAGVAACEALRAAGIGDAEIDWPNDVTVAGRKIAGTLVEVRSRAGETLDVIVGTGFNVDHREGDFPPELRDRATSVRILRPGLPDGIAALASRYAAALIALAGELSGLRWDEVRRRWMELAPGSRGRPVRVEAAGAPARHGITVGIDARGALLVRDRGGMVQAVPPATTVVAAEA